MTSNNLPPSSTTANTTAASATPETTTNPSSSAKTSNDNDNSVMIEFQSSSCQSSCPENGSSPSHISAPTTTTTTATLSSSDSMDEAPHTPAPLPPPPSLSSDLSQDMIIDSENHSTTTTITDPQTPTRTPHQCGLAFDFLDGNGSSSGNDRSPNSSPFKLPESILKNLTPVSSKDRRSNSDNDCYKRRIEQLREMNKLRLETSLKSRRDKLIKKSKVIQKKLNDLQILNDNVRSQRIKKLNDEYHQAQERKKKYLEAIKRRASVGGSIIGTSMMNSTVSLNTVNVTAGAEHVTKSESNSFDAEDANLSDMATSEEKFDQFVHEKHVKEISTKLLESGILDEYENYTPQQVFQVFSTGSAYRNDIKLILTHYNIPEMSKSYRSFFYSFIMIAEFKQCVVKRFGISPSFNSNLPDQDSRNLLKNFLWLLLFKFSHELIFDFKQLLINGDNIGNLLSTWNSYTFIFKIFKQYDYQDLNKMIDSALTTVNIQLELIENDNVIDEYDDDADNFHDGISNHKLGFLKEKEHLNLLYDKSLESFVNDEESQTFLMAINHELQFNHLINSEISKKLYVKSFYLPKMKNLSQLQWRQFWFKFYLSSLHNSCDNKTSISMKTGIMKLGNFESSPPASNFIQITDIYESLGIEKPPNTDNNSKKSNESLQNLVYSVLLDLCLYYNKMGKGIVASKLKSRRIGLNTDNPSEVIKDNLLTIQDLILSLSPQDYILHEYPQKCLGMMGNDSNTLNSEESRLQFSEHLQEFDNLVSNLLLNAYNVTSFQLLNQIETSHLIYNSPYYNILTSKSFVNSPHLLFPKFYRFLKSFNGRNKLELNNYLNILESTSFNFKREVNHQGLHYIQSIYFDMLADQDHDALVADEFNTLCYDDLESLRRQIKCFINANVLTYVLSSYKVPDLTNTFAKTLQFFSIGEGDLKTFIVNSLQIRPEICQSILQIFSNTQLHSVYVAKFLALLKDFTATPESYKMSTSLAAAFPWCKSVALGLIMNIRELVVFFTNVYGQLFSWIYHDLGKPCCS